MRIYDITLKDKRVLKVDKKINMYVCGPTLYGDIHIGNARPIIFFDVVYRSLLYFGYEVKYISNITDIDDKIILKAKELKITEEKLVEQNILEYKKVLDKLNLLDIKRIRVTEYIEKIIDFINRLVDLEFAYESDGNVFFRIHKAKDYGKMSNRDVSELNIGERIDISLIKESKEDFVLWKKTDTGITWNSPYGKGRPGWHTECAAMIEDVFENKINIHGGGVDLKFPHHENENCQFNSIHREDITDFWMHNGMVNIDGEKMSKSKNNFWLVKDVLEEYGTNVTKLLLLQTNYRQPIEITNSFIEQTVNLNKKIQNYLLTINMSTVNKTKDNRIKECIENDFNTSNLITLLVNGIRENESELVVTIVDILGLSVDKVDEIPKEIYKLADVRREKKKEKKFSEADDIKKQINEMGYTIDDTRQGEVIRKV